MSTLCYAAMILPGLWIPHSTIHILVSCVAPSHKNCPLQTRQSFVDTDIYSCIVPRSQGFPFTDPKLTS